jgi:hypothetical protein
MKNPPALSFLTRLMNEYAGGGHSIFAPSGSAMWLYCSGSLIANLLEEDEGSFEAAEGTVAHELAEQWLKSGIKPSHRLGETVVVSEGEGKPEYHIVIDEVMLDYVEEYVKWCQFEEGDHFVETKVYFTDLMPPANMDELEEDPLADEVPFEPQGGTADHACCRPGILIISDLKYGKGIFVDAVNNTQARLYALGFFYKWDWKYNFQRIVIRIGQPRLDNWGVWEITREELLEYAEFVRERAREAWKLNAPRRVSKKGCQWCKVKATCTAMAVTMEDLAYAELAELERELGAEEMSRIRELLKEEFDMHLRKVSSLSVPDMVKILDFRKPMEDWFAAIHANLEGRSNDGQRIEGMKLVEGRSNRAWNSESKIKTQLEFVGVEEKHMYEERKLKSPNQMEEMLRKEYKMDRKTVGAVLIGYDYKPPGKPTLVKDDDPRVELNDVDDGIWDDQ